MVKFLNRWTLAVFIICLLFIAPAFLGTYLTTLFFITFMFISLSLSYDIMGGITGYLNFGHCTFFGIGAYTFGILYLSEFNLLLCFIAPVLVVMVYAALISIPLFRIRGVYFCLASIGLVKLIEQLTLNLSDLTGGAAGMSVPTGQQLYPAYYMGATLAILAFFINYKILRSKFGLALTSIREDEEVALSFGINTYRYKALALILSSAIAAFMGEVYIFYVTYTIPSDVFGIERVFSPVIMALLGGTGTLFGPVIGAISITVLQEILWSKLPYLHLTAYGIIFALVGLYMPGGILREPKVRVVLGRIAKVLGHFPKGDHEK